MRFSLAKEEEWGKQMIFRPSSCLLREGWDSRKVENVLEEAEKRTISYFSFHSSGCSRSNPGTSVFWKRPFCISETDANERVLPGWKNAKESRLCSAGPFCEFFSSAATHVLRSDVYDASVSQTISRDFALKFTRDSPRSLCSRSSLSLTPPLSFSLSLFLSSFLSRNFILHME